MSATVLITFGALLGFASSTQLLFIAAIETVIGCVNLWLVTHVFKLRKMHLIQNLLHIYYLHCTSFSTEKIVFNVSDRVQ